MEQYELEDLSSTWRWSGFVAAIAVTVAAALRAIEAAAEEPSHNPVDHGRTSLHDETNSDRNLYATAHAQFVG